MISLLLAPLVVIGLSCGVYSPRGGMKFQEVSCVSSLRIDGHRYVCDALDNPCSVVSKTRALICDDATITLKHLVCAGEKK